MDTLSLNQSLKRLEQLITRDAESFSDPRERQIEFDRRLERARRLMTCLGDPQNSYPVIHIGGTSGKGSVAMLCESMLQASGLKVGTHTTPYLQTPLEKARVDGQLIDAQEAVALAEQVMACVTPLQAETETLGHPHYAEAWLGLALRAFADQTCDAGIIEVGMGGRYDCTNIVTPRVSAVTSIHYDHIRVLGDTIEEIAGHKAGIIKPGAPAVAGEMFPEAQAVIEAEARRAGSRLVRIGREATYQPLELTQQGGRFSYHGLHMTLDDARVGLLGAHQFANAATALATLELFAEQTGLALDAGAIRDGLANVRFAGRLEVMQREPTVVLDGAHNEEKIAALAAAVTDVFPRRKVILILGLLEAKSVLPMLRKLAGLADTVITTAPTVKGKPAISSSQLAHLARDAGARGAIDGGAPLEALDRALALASPDDLVVASGSLYLIGALRSRWHSVDDIIARRTTFPNGKI